MSSTATTTVFLTWNTLRWAHAIWSFMSPGYTQVYSPPISTKYSEVYWTMMDPVPMDKDLVARFQGKTMAIVGYESDQVIVTEGQPDVSVPITHAYNHHFEVP